MSNDVPKLKIEVHDKEAGIYVIEGVRPSFPNLWKPGKTKTGSRKSRLDTSFVYDRSEKKFTAKLMKLFLGLAQAERGKIKKPKDVEYFRLEKMKNTDFMAIKTSNDVRYPATYFNHKGDEVKDPLAAGADRELYAGCYCRIKIQVNCTTSGKDVQMWCNLVAIQWLADGPKFGGGGLKGKELAKGFGKVSNKSKFSKKPRSKKDKSRKSKKSKHKKSKKEKITKGKKSKDKYTDADLGF